MIPSEIASCFHLIGFLLKTRVINITPVCSIRVFLFLGQRAKYKWVSWDEEMKSNREYADGTMSPSASR